MSLILLLISVVLIVVLTARYNLHPFLALLLASFFFAFSSGMSFEVILDSINTGFGNTLGSIGMVILFGIIIGAFLEHTGAAFKLAEVVLRMIGKKRVHGAMGIMGFLISIPVFADSGYILLHPLNKSLSKKAGLSLAGTGVTLMLGLMLTHVLVPPTPGPIAAAGIIGADVGRVMILGLIVGLVSLPVAVLYGKYYAGKTYIDPNPEVDGEDIVSATKSAPGAFQSFLPIVVPIILIIAKSILELQLGDALPNRWQSTLIFLGTPVIALFIGMLLAFTLPKKLEQSMFSTSGWVGKALLDGALILLITGAGGIFGKVLQQSGIATDMQNLLSGVNLGIWLPFILTAAIKTAQGSSTVALITTAGIMAPMMVGMGFESEWEKALMVVSIGAGAAVVPHANDSGFWVFTQLTGMDIKTGYRLYTFGGFLTGTFAALMIFIVSLFL
ncbi:MAG TPA: GntP family permease [Saprospiraceae bacterium]|nr:GntP family permease [Saprospiraceae bacterium]